VGLPQPKMVGAAGVITGVAGFNPRFTVTKTGLDSQPAAFLTVILNINEACIGEISVGRVTGKTPDPIATLDKGTNSV
jgi:hypothetical protein